MANPSQVFSRIRRNRSRVAAPRQAVNPPAPAPAPASPAVPDPAPAPPERRPVTRPAGSHALYSQLMRSHDRMGTRHLK